MSEFPSGALDEGLERLAREGEIRLSADGKTPLSGETRLTVNGAPITEQSHEFVVGRRDAKN